MVSRFVNLPSTAKTGHGEAHSRAETDFRAPSPQRPFPYPASCENAPRVRRFQSQGLTRFALDDDEVGSGQRRMAVERDEQDCGPCAIAVGIEKELAVIGIVEEPGIAVCGYRRAARIEIDRAGGEADREGVA